MFNGIKCLNMDSKINAVANLVKQFNQQQIEINKNGIQNLQEQICGYNGDKQECFNFDNGIQSKYLQNFIISFLQKIPLDDKLKQVNSIIPRYTKIDMQIKETKHKGLGIFLNEDIGPSQKIFKFNVKKVISSYQINQRLFLQSTLTLQHKKIQLSQQKFQKIVKNEKYLKNFLFMRNLLYHFGRINDSMMKEEIVAFPLQKKLPYHDISDDELQLFDYNLKSYNKQLVQRLIMTKFEYSLFQKTLRTYMKDEQFNFYFQQESLNIQEYYYLELIASTRCHRHHQHKILIPILNFANQADSIKNKKDYSIEQKSFRRNIYIHVNQKAQFNQSEFVIDYGYQDIKQYAFISGFVPKHLKQCLEIKNISDKLQKHQYPRCIDSYTIQIYLIILLMENDFDCVKQKSIYPFQIENFQNNYYLMKKCNYNIDILQNIKKQIHSQIKLIQGNLKQIQMFLKFDFDSKIAQILLDYQQKFLNHIILIKEEIQDLDNNLKSIFM